MSICKFIQRLLKIKAFSVRNFTFHICCKDFWLEVKPYKNGGFCPHCKRRGKIITTLEEPRVLRLSLPDELYPAGNGRGSRRFVDNSFGLE